MKIKPAPRKSSNSRKPRNLANPSERDVTVGPKDVAWTTDGFTATAGDFGVAISGLGGFNNDLTKPGRAKVGQRGCAIVGANGRIDLGTYAVGYAARNSQIWGGAGGFATVEGGGTSVASVGDGGVARVSGYVGEASTGNGIAYVTQSGNAHSGPYGTAVVSRSGFARNKQDGIASVRKDGYAMAGPRGVAIGWMNCTASAGERGVIVLGGIHPVTGQVTLVVGSVSAQGPLLPGVPYRLDKGLKFVEAPKVLTPKKPKAPSAKAKAKVPAKSAKPSTRKPARKP